MATEKTLQSVYKPKKQIHNHQDLMDEQFEFRMAQREKAKVLLPQESLYAIKKDGAKMAGYTFLAWKDFQASRTFIEYLLDNRKNKEDEVIRLYRIGTYDRKTMAFISEAAPIEIKASDDAQNLIIR